MAAGQGEDGGYAVVDVETTGFGEHDRVVQVAVTTLTPDLRVEQEWSSLVDPLRNPGPVHIHGVTPQRLQGARGFGTVAPQVADLLAGRVLVAHNADFDYRMLDAELTRAGVPDPVQVRLCTIRLARRLELPVPGYALAVLAEHYGIDNPGAHDARHDTWTTVELLRRLLAEARAYAVDLPLTRCRGAAEWSPTGRGRAVTSPFVNPGRWRPGWPLQAGMVFLVTGTTTVPAGSLGRLGAEAGLAVATGLAPDTSFVVHGGSTPTRRLVSARSRGIPTMTEEEFLALVGRTLTGVRRPRTETAPAPPEDAPGEPEAAEPAAAAAGPWVGTRVLVLGGDPGEAARARLALAAAGAVPVVRLTRTVDLLLTLPGAGNDPDTADLQAAARARGVPVRQDLPEPPDPAGQTPPAALPADARAMTVQLDWRTAPSRNIVVTAELREAGQQSSGERLDATRPDADDGAVTLRALTAGEAWFTVRCVDLDDAIEQVDLLASPGPGQRPGPVRVRIRVDGRPWWSATVDLPEQETPAPLLRLRRGARGWDLTAGPLTAGPLAGPTSVSRPDRCPL